ncbi:hypothetical protein FOCC_FOCC015555 [Frankliniella occidentalis]|nr:uncharacterized protein LOC113203992 isoform X2 [Frankliniella occidentalis]KAE8738955.1 hypothetical protein FOCC_FOCC015555 [Frankliniella occidentalis]
MSHSVTVTRTTTTTTTSAILLNTGYFKTYPGLLKLFELLIGAAIVGITAHYGSNYYHNYVTQSPEIFLCIVATTFMVGTACLLLSCILSISTASILPKTLFEVIFHSVATILYLAASINFLVEVNQMKKNYGYKYEPYLAAAILGLINTVLYLLSTFLAYRSYKGK